MKKIHVKAVTPTSLSARWRRIRRPMSAVQFRGTGVTTGRSVGWFMADWGGRPDRAAVAGLRRTSNFGRSAPRSRRLSVPLAPWRLRGSCAAPTLQGLNDCAEMSMNRVLTHTGARYPIVQAPMGWIARSALASAVSRAGALGIIETSSGETQNCQHEIRCMVATGLPFGVNLPIRFLKDDAMLRFVCEVGIRFVTTSAGSPAKFVAPLKAAGIVVYHAVPTLEAALKCVDAGVDGL